MYIPFALVASLLVYATLLLALGATRRTAIHPGRVGHGSFAVLVGGLVVFNLASGAIGVDLGPFHTVSYSIPDDYLARGTLGLLALVPYVVACLSPALTLALFANRR